MFESDPRPVSLRTSPSAINNNLSTYSNKLLAYVHLAQVQIHNLTTNASSKVCYKDTTHVTQAKWVDLQGRTVLVLTTHNGVQVFEKDGSLLLFWHSLDKLADTDVGIQQVPFARGIGGCKKRLFIGAHDGSVLVFTAGKDFSFETKLSVHKSAITDIAAAGSV
eukprot:Colp12_sorted_trinity150504_noHs@10812